MDIEDNEIALFPNRVADGEDDNLYGKIVSNEDEAYNLYNTYALRVGFSVRRGRKRYSGKPINISQREFVCSKESITNDENPLEVKKVNRLETRTGCKAFIQFNIENDVWKVTNFKPTHNHDLASPLERHLLKSSRKISKEKAGVIDTMKNAGLNTKDVYAYISTEHGEDENVGFLQKDCSNHVHRQKMVKVEAGDAQSPMNYLKKKKAEDPMFFYAVQVDQKNRLTNFFWRDGRSKIDYDSFGDVMIFDTTFRTNKYNLICAPFVSVNHHWNNVMFGCAFLLDETAASFKWLFQSFLESMGNREPQAIFTDQDAAMAKAIREVFKTTKHRLCLWHISKNAPSHLGHLNGDSDFQVLWNKCCT
ncbi:unnamed protein product [Linum trigynum]|uniref:Protein FAR1-RELATED SEQUENCE n=1 Tax=Linum trigynum TaxID=586398 RepID=A0AAV2DZR6_9ROSI